MTNQHQLFDRTLYLMRRQRSGNRFSAHDFLHRDAEACIIERLDIMDRSFNHALVIGAPTDAIAHHPRIKQCLFADNAPSRLPNTTHPSCIMDDEWLPIADNSLDAIISLLTLHHVNDVAGTLIQMRRALKPDGLLLVVTFGARTLMELRNAMTDAEMQQTGGISPRISPFMEVRDGGALLQRAGFALPVADSEIRCISYDGMLPLCAEIRGMGEANVLHDRRRTMTGRGVLQEAASAYNTGHTDAEGRLRCTVELLFLTGWTPHASQQQPAKRGSGQVHLGQAF